LFKFYFFIWLLAFVFYSIIVVPIAIGTPFNFIIQLVFFTAEKEVNRVFAE